MGDLTMELVEGIVFRKSQRRMRGAGSRTKRAQPFGCAGDRLGELGSNQEQGQSGDQHRLSSAVKSASRSTWESRASM